MAALGVQPDRAAPLARDVRESAHPVRVGRARPPFLRNGQTKHANQLTSCDESGGLLVAAPTRVASNRSFRSFIAAATAAVTFIGCASAARSPPQIELARPAAPPESADEPIDPPGVARAILQMRLLSHESEMRSLVAAIMALDYDRVRDRADVVAADAALVGPLGDDAIELGSTLPERLFPLADELRVRALELASAAGEGSAVQVADAYAELSRTCVSCHAAYSRQR